MCAERGTEWNFPYAVGALGGKQMYIHRPGNASQVPGLSNYRGSYSIIMLALVDGDYKFIYFDVTAARRAGDAGVWKRCSLRKAIENGRLNLPPPACLPGTNSSVPHILTADNAFPLTPYVMTPYKGHTLGPDQTVFNVRLSRHQSLVENAFGMLCQRFGGVFRGSTSLDPHSMVDTVCACLCLHNMLRSQEIARQTGQNHSEPGNVGLSQGGGTSALKRLRAPSGRPSTRAETRRRLGEVERDKFTAYFVSPEGSVP